MGGVGLRGFFLNRRYHVRKVETCVGMGAVE